jgi:tRNA A-37 threonylcarbamoyl transferase component Bud32
MTYNQIQLLRDLSLEDFPSNGKKWLQDFANFIFDHPTIDKFQFKSKQFLRNNSNISFEIKFGKIIIPISFQNHPEFNVVKQKFSSYNLGSEDNPFQFEEGPNSTPLFAFPILGWLIDMFPFSKFGNKYLKWKKNLIKYIYENKKEFEQNTAQGVQIWLHLSHFNKIFPNSSNLEKIFIFTYFAYKKFIEQPERVINWFNLDQILTCLQNEDEKLMGIVSVNLDVEYERLFPQYGNWFKGKRIGGGGQGSVYKCKHAQTDQVAAMKILKRYDKKSIIRLKSEIKIMQNITTFPNVIHIIDTIQNESNQMIGYVMVVADDNLGTFLRNKGVSIKQKLKLFREVLMGLKSLHKLPPKPILHRDLKPPNILILEGKVKLADFGLGIDLSEENLRKTQDNEMIGPRRMNAPEQSNGKCENPTPALDYYLAGHILYFILSNGNYLWREHYNEDDFKLSIFHSDQRYCLFNKFFELTLKEKPEDRCQDIDLLISEYDNIVHEFFGN